MTSEEILETLTLFTGTERWYRYSPLFPNVLLTDGAKFIADECGAYWLMDVIGSHLPAVKRAGERFAIAVLAKKTPYEGGWYFHLVDDIPSNVTYARQDIEFSDFPLDEIKLYVIDDGEHVTILLPSEY